MAQFNHSNNHEQTVKMLADNDGWQFSFTVSLLAVGFFSNVYIIWMTTRHRFPVHWETFRLILRYSSIVDLSLCAAIAWFGLLPHKLYHVGGEVTLKIQCGRYGVDTALGRVTICGVVAASRQVSMLLTFDDEMTLRTQNSSRTMKLIRVVTFVGVVSFVSWILLKRFAPDITILMCFVSGDMTSHTTYVLLVPVVVNVVLGVVVVACPTCPVTGCEQSQSMSVVTIDSLYRTKLVDHASSPSEKGDIPADVSVSRWRRFVIVNHVGLATWFALLVAMAFTGVLTSLLSSDVLSFLAGSSALISAWSAFAVYAYWT